MRKDWRVTKTRKHAIYIRGDIKKYYDFSIDRMLPDAPVLFIDTSPFIMTKRKIIAVPCLKKENDAILLLYHQGTEDIKEKWYYKDRQWYQEI